MAEMTSFLRILWSLVHLTYYHCFDSLTKPVIPDLARDYCIIGAGPGGLQMGYYLKKAGRDYIIFEQNDKPGSFFERFPRHRKLISINKRHTGRTNREFNLRHDWNSLLTDDFSLLFTNYSKEYFPQADDILRYLKDYAEKFQLNIQYNTRIGNVAHNIYGTNEICRFTMRNQQNDLICCRSVMVATGLPIRLEIKIPGSEYIEHYDSISVDPEDYEGQSIFIIGRGNSGFEVAISIYGRANYVHMSARDRLRFSWDTHYVGDLRAVNNEIVDAYMLKSLDGFVEVDAQQLKITRRAEDSKFLIEPRNMSEFTSKPAQLFKERMPTRHGYDRVISCMGFKWDSSIFNEQTTVSAATPNERIFSTDETPEPKVGKYPQIGQDYESLDYPGLYFIGTLSHSLDFRKSAGGFIHGFRYTIRALHRLLESKNHDVTWPKTEHTLDQLVTVFLNRANEASGIYQMFGVLVDVAIVDRIKDTFVYLREFPMRLIPRLPHYTGHEFDPDRNDLFVMSLEYGKNFSVPGKDHFVRGRAVNNVKFANYSNFLHPVFHFYRGRLPQDFVHLTPKEFMPGADGLHHTMEDFTTTFDGPLSDRLPLRRFVEECLGKNLKSYTAEDCVVEALVSTDSTPLSCHKYLNSYNLM